MIDACAVQNCSKKTVNYYSINFVPQAHFGKGGSDTYSIWLYKGGARCNHRWTRKLYARKGGRSLGEAISTTQAIKRGFRPETNAKKVSIAPKNMKYAGYTAAYWNKKGFVK